MLRQHALELTTKQVMRGDGLDRAVDIAKSDDRQQQPHHGVTVPPKPVQIPLGTCLAHEEHDGSAAVERRNRQQIKRAEKQV